ncbi:Pyr-redox-2 domain-containing protein [Fusarium sp. LHS14.1]|nr:Pyr-redox-2 domain-containing protein [Fusarium sp. LHS14.1]
MASGDRSSYNYLALAAVAAQPPLAHPKSHGREGGIIELQGFQQRISKAERISVVDGGAVVRKAYDGVRGKVHRQEVHSFAFKNIEVLLKERPALPSQAGQAGQAGQPVQETQVAPSHGQKRISDLVISCTNLCPRSDLLAPFSSKSIALTGEIPAKPALQADSIVRAS